MNWVTTNIRLPEDVYLSLKMQAAVSRKSIADIIRAKISEPSATRSSASLLDELDSLGEEFQKDLKGKNLTKMLITSRYTHV